MRQKIDITDVETATKIRAKYLRALENEEFDLLHGGTFVRSFLRTYAQYLGLDAQRLIEEYRIQHEPRDEAEFQHIAPIPQRRREPPRGPRGRGAVIAAAVVGLLGFLLVLGLTGGDGDEGDGRGAEPAETQARQERPARDEPAPRPRRRRAAARRVRVRVAPATPVYVCWDRGPGTEPAEINPLASARTFRGRRIRLNIGNPSARITVDGRRVALDGPGPFGFDLRPGRVREIPAGERPCA